MPPRRETSADSAARFLRMRRSSPCTGAVGAQAAPLRLRPTPEALLARALAVQADLERDVQTVTVPADFVVHRVAISEDRTITIALPRRMTRREVERLHAFLLTQVDE